MKRSISITTILMLCVSAAIADPWEKVIPAVEERSAFYLDEAERLGYADIETGDVDYLDYYREDHECGILGRMFDFSELVADYEHLDTPRLAEDLTDIEVVQLFAAGRTLEAWLQQVNCAVKQSKVERVQRWNEACAGNRIFDYAPNLLAAAVPGFDAFPVFEIAAAGSPTAMPDFDRRDAWARMFRTRIRDGVTEGPNFNAHYSFIVSGCGASCLFSFITDTQTGQVFQPPFGGDTTPELNIDFQLESNLIHVIHMGNTSAECLVLSSPTRVVRPYS